MWGVGLRGVFCHGRFGILRVAVVVGLLILSRE